MQFERRKRFKLLNQATNEEENQYPYWINFYTRPPIYTALMQEIEDVCSERMRILQIVDNILKSTDNCNHRRLGDIYETIISQIQSLKAKSSGVEKNFYVAGRCTSDLNTSKQCYEARKRDHISHFLLRIYYCQNEELRRWFISREGELFRIRFIDSSDSNLSSLEDCLAYYGYKFEIVSSDDPDYVHNLIYWAKYGKHNSSSIAFKLRFEDALDLVRNRKVYLNDGYAYIASQEMISVICNQFKSNLSRELNRMRADFYSFAEPRLILQLESLHQTYFANFSKNRKNDDSDTNKEMFDIENIDQIANEFFPPCMRSIHETLRREHHLKHYGRLYYGLYLKSIGLRLDDALDFFRSEFSIKNPERFQKEYAYTIRYIYGKEGKRVQLSAYSCQKIISENAPGPNDTHGCPFRHYDVKNLKSMLVRYGINNEADIEEIISRLTSTSIKASAASEACTRYFSLKYNRQLPETYNIHHPNQFYTDAKRSVINVANFNNFHQAIKRENQSEIKENGSEEQELDCDESIIVKDELYDSLLNDSNIKEEIQDDKKMRIN
ncbi:DNA primase large subunit [Sarcoptes scabiei]|uniref:DNA primase large subunit n=1 Tax=Sarcoptes scabiei TaxID=52283 RepID=A0A132AA58_SARSC|nr:DNA primase large subunit [Sarcoptes scabiei]KPM07803.1 DNA primase large subunit-like protein [Sarcoptes scabiei]